MHERIAVVTGATSGIGKEIARALARSGHRVGIVARHPVRCGTAVEELRADVPDAMIDTFLADLSTLADVRRAAGEIRARYPRLDVLVNNAGVHLLRPKVSPDGFDRMVATNHLGPFLLTNLLRELLEKSAPSRVVNVASEAHRHADRVDVERFAEPGHYGRGGSLRVYGRSKLLNILFTQELAERLAGTGVTVNAVCPGFVATGLADEVPGARRMGALLSRTPLVRTPEQGARMAVRLATDPEFEGRTGGFYSSTPGAGLLPTTPELKDPELRRAVWERSVRLVGLPVR
ncbi:SDR family NAD(P)-dependent oxidoreductase [Actinomadura namibiensis]|uniref:NAD(P)-dependent dehydrogenase (Short-subunit alcohol dehydrogenase family) n=1 Tax=Actinomadura namibiensis TaxID=182080 RepID=A0A7W3LNR2_ACTNM|nr:SDR family NAD(P)-dependent oxidoreductase [Actinomadura namibiensis]MBA8951526.1 NAD(P)-dependent dehydrogenase (short-subunit alcohol dehydrogenase family) [Actinomadura namibiensis]